MSTNKYSLGPEERIKSRDEAIRLFKSPDFVHLVHPIRMAVCLKQKETGQPTFKALFTAPKKRFPKAHDRNKAKRMLREVYRLSKPLIVEKAGTDPGEILFMLTYVGRIPPSYKAMQAAWVKCLTKIFPDEQPAS